MANIQKEYWSTAMSDTNMGSLEVSIFIRGMKMGASKMCAKVCTFHPWHEGWELRKKNLCCVSQNIQKAETGDK